MTSVYVRFRPMVAFADEGLGVESKRNVLEGRLLRK